MRLNLAVFTNSSETQPYFIARLAALQHAARAAGNEARHTDRLDERAIRDCVAVVAGTRSLWPLVQQTVEATIEGLEQAWAFFGGLPVRLILDNFFQELADTPS